MRTAIACPEPDPEGRYPEAVKYPASTILGMLATNRARIKCSSEEEILLVLNRLTRPDHGMTPAQCRCCLLSCLAFIDFYEASVRNLRMKTEFVLTATTAPTPEVELALEKFIPNHMDSFCWRGVDFAMSLWHSLNREQQKSVRRLHQYDIVLYFLVSSWESNYDEFLMRIRDTIFDLECAGARLTSERQEELRDWLVKSSLLNPLLFD